MKEKQEFIVRNDVPMPTRKKRTKKRTLKYPFEMLEVGDSFHIPAVDGDVEKALRRASGSAHNAKKYFNGERIFKVCRAEEPDLENGIDGDPDGPGARVYRKI